jgi:hypothetical protein
LILTAAISCQPDFQKEPVKELSVEAVALLQLPVDWHDNETISHQHQNALLLPANEMKSSSNVVGNTETNETTLFTLLLPTND